jgi:hypothetical protein
VVETPVSNLKTLQQLVADGQSTQPKVAQICAGWNKTTVGGPSDTATDFDARACTAPLTFANQSAAQDRHGADDRKEWPT